jgi:hypothetical protein
MMDLITEHIEAWTGAEILKANGGKGRGRGANGQSPHGIKKLRELILELAVGGKLVEQNPSDEPARVLLEKITKEKARLFRHNSGLADSDNYRHNLKQLIERKLELYPDIGKSIVEAIIEDDHGKNRITIVSMPA